MPRKTTPRPRSPQPRKHAPRSAGVPFICCQLAAICLLAGRDLEHIASCANHKSPTAQPRP